MKDREFLELIVASGRGSLSAAKLREIHEEAARRLARLEHREAKRLGKTTMAASAADRGAVPGCPHASEPDAAIADSTPGGRS